MIHKLVILHNSTTEGTHWCTSTATFNIFVSLAVIHVALKYSTHAVTFPRQLLLDKCATMLYYTHIANLVCDCPRYCRQMT